MSDIKSFISKEDCVKVLQNYLQTSNGIKYISSELKTISENVEGFMGEHYKLIINYEISGVHNTSKFFVKTKPRKSNEHKEVTEGLGAYEKEIFIYDSLLKEFEKYGLDVSFAAKSYFCIPGETLIMNDVTLDGYVLTDMNKKMSIEHLKVVLEALAKYHAAGFAYEDRKSKELGRKFILGEEYNNLLKESFYVQYIDQNMFAMNWWASLNKTMNALFNFLPKNEADELKNLLEKGEISKNFAVKTNIRKTCGHGDLWNNNILFKCENNIPISCKLIDFQVCRYFYPCFDVLLVIYCNTNTEFRRQHLNDLYLYYHKTLAEILNNYGLNIKEIYPLEDYYESIKLLKVEAVMQMILTNIIIKIPKETVNKRMNDGKNGTLEVLIDNDVVAVEAYNTVEDYKNSILESFNVLKEVLLERVNST